MQETSARVYTKDSTKTRGGIWYVVNRFEDGMIYVDAIDKERKEGIIILRYILGGSSERGYNLDLVRQTGDTEFVVMPEDVYYREALNAVINFMAAGN